MDGYIIEIGAAVKRGDLAAASELLDRIGDAMLDLDGDQDELPDWHGLLAKGRASVHAKAS